VDEVLAVGDVEFQKKCLGKMRDVSANDGRTVLFVSHNMAAIKNLCSHGLYLRQGGVVLFSNIDETLNSYFIEDSNNKKTNIESDFETSDSNVDSYFISWKLLNGISESAMYSRKDCNLKTTFFTKVSIPKAELGLVLRDYKGDIIYACNSRDNGGDFLDIEQGEYSFDFSFRFPAKMGNYEIDIAIVSDNKVICHMQSNRKLQVLSEFDSILDEKWSGIISEPLFFKYLKK
jgi:lipopolysaccharide transport system ATP-binding protein